MTHQLSPAEALALLMRHADYQSRGGSGDRTEPICTAIPGEVLEQCRRALGPVEPRAEAGAVFLVWSHEHAAWWRDHHCGYTTHLAAAGRYSEAEALKICERAGWSTSEAPPEIPVREADVVSLQAYRGPHGARRNL